jgi:Dyp-type peroxidase family
MVDPPLFLGDVQTNVLSSVDPRLVVYLFFRIKNRRCFVEGLPVPPKPSASRAKPSALRAGDNEPDSFVKSELERDEPESAFESQPEGDKAGFTFKSELDRVPAELLEWAPKGADPGGGWSFKPAPPRFQGFANIAFTYTGLKALGVHEHTLATFPEPFRDGMAARAATLGDVGDTAPDRWDGYLGSREVHGVKWLSIVIPSRAETAISNGYDIVASAARDRLASSWIHPDVTAVAPYRLAELELSAELRPIVEALNRKAGGADPLHIDGAEVLHVEIGMANYVPGGDGKEYRVEHFGYRDGVSQPYANIGLDPPAPGGGTPRQNNSWAPVAIGEILLGQVDEDGRIQHLPANKRLRQNGTYLAIRKLEQDVVGFRDFLKRNQVDEHAEALGAQMVGRWPDGAPLVLFPNGPEESRSPGQTINDFRYQRDDPLGRRCPIGAHIRRANPRDTNDRDEARRHRLFRRSMSYGGKLLPRDSPGDGRTRGLIFASMQTRIDRQFEFVLTSWLGRGEFEGQAGARRDPVIGAHRGHLEDAFQPTKAFGPVVRLPRFVTMRGGDYFFLPSFAALAQFKANNNFAPDDPNAPLPQNALGYIHPAETDNSSELIALGKRLLAPGQPSYAPLTAVVTTQYPGGPPLQVNSIVVGRYDYVVQALTMGAYFDTWPLDQRAQQITGGQRLLIGMDAKDPERVKRLEFLHRALQKLDRPSVSKIADFFAKTALSRVLPLGRLDVVNDFGRVIPILCAGALLGVQGPDYVSAAGVAALFGRFDMTDIPDDWLQSLPSIEDYAKPLSAMQAWTRLSFLQIFVNAVDALEIVEEAERGTREFLRQIDDLILQARRTQRSGKPRNLLEALVRVPLDPTDLPDPGRHARLLLAEFAAGSVETVNAALANIFDYLLDHEDLVRQAVCKHLGLGRRPSLDKLVEQMNDDTVDLLMFEILRLNPMGPIAFRRCIADALFGTAPVVPEGTNVILVPAAAMVDPRQFPEPYSIRFDRDPDSYLHFGAGVHRCGGQRIDHPIAYHLALPMLRALFRNLAGLPQLRRAAGAAGKLSRTFPILADSLIMRFTPS